MLSDKELSPDEEAGSSVTMLLALYNIAEGKSDLPKKSINELTHQAPNLIPNMVIALNLWTKSCNLQSDLPPYVQAANKPTTPFSGKKVGRNALCPCGSGRKYKHCCMAK